MKKVGLVVGIAAVVIIIAGVALWKYHEQPQFCAICHLMQPYLESWESPPLLAYAHAEEDITCLECHEPTIQQQVDELVKFVTKDYESPLQEREFDQQWCLRCHEHGSPRPELGPKAAAAGNLGYTEHTREEWTGLFHEGNQPTDFS